jgi:hypothetical protein
MAKKVGSQYTAAQGRRFALTVGAAFLVFAAIAWWRGNPIATNVLAGLGGVLVLAALIMPAYLGPVERGWMKLAHLISKVTTPIVMGVMYLGVITPIGALRRAMGGNALVHAEQEHGFWRTRAVGARRSASMQRQF